MNTDGETRMVSVSALLDRVPPDPAGGSLPAGWGWVIAERDPTAQGYEADCGVEGPSIALRTQYIQNISFLTYAEQYSYLKILL